VLEGSARRFTVSFDPAFPRLLSLEIREPRCCSVTRGRPSSDPNRPEGFALGVVRPPPTVVFAVEACAFGQISSVRSRWSRGRRGAAACEADRALAEADYVIPASNVRMLSFGSRPTPLVRSSEPRARSSTAGLDESAAPILFLEFGISRLGDVEMFEGTSGLDL